MAYPEEQSEAPKPSVRLAPYNPSHITVQRAVLSLLKLTPDDMLFDLGCGDGRLLLTAAETVPGLRCVGIEFDKTFASRANRRMAEAASTCKDIMARVTIEHGDVMDRGEDVSNFATAVFVYLVPHGLRAVRPMLEAVRKKKNGRIASFMFAVPGWDPSDVCRETKGGWPVYLYGPLLPTCAVERT